MKKLISLLLVLCMAFSLMAMSVSAEEVNVDPNLEGSWDYVQDNEIFDEDVEPKDDVTRGDYAIYMARLVCDDFDAWTIPNDYQCVLTDMQGDTTEVGKAVAFCYINGLVNGRGDGKYHPEQTVTREQICALLYRAYVEPVNGVEEAPLAGQFTLSETDNVTTFTDDISDWAEAAVEWAATYGIVVGHSDGTFGGSGTEVTTQEQMAAILHRFVENETEAVTTTKFYLGVTSGEGYAKVAVNHAYVMNITLSPEKLNPASVTLTAQMNDVASLKVSESKSHSTTISTGLTGDPSLKDWMPQAWAFKDCNININITDVATDVTKSCVYVVTGSTADNGDAVIAFVPENVDDTRAAWHHLVNDTNLTISEYAEDDSYITIGALSYLQIGSEKLVMENGADLVLDNFSAMEELKQTIRDGVKLETGVAPAAIVASVDENTALRVGQTEAALNVPVTVTIVGMDGAEMTVLSELRAAESTYDMATLLVGALGELIDELDKMGEVTVNVEFDSSIAE